MTSEKKEISFFICPNGDPHDFEYRGRVAQAYRCKRCQVVISKSDLKAATDA